MVDISFMAYLKGCGAIFIILMVVAGVLWVTETIERTREGDF